MINLPNRKYGKVKNVGFKYFFYVLVMVLSARIACAGGVAIKKITVMSGNVEMPVEVAIPGGTGFSGHGAGLADWTLYRSLAHYP